MFTVYLIVDFLLFLIGIMQTLLNTHSFALHVSWKRMTAGASYGLLASLTLLLLLSFGNQAKAASFIQNSVTVASAGGRDGGQNTVNGTYYTALGSSTPKFTTDISNLGLFDRGTGSLTLGAGSVTTEVSTETITSLQLFYRVYQVTAADPTGANATKPGFLPLVLQASNTTINGDGSKTKEWTSTNAADILNAAPVEGNYLLEFFFQAVSTNNADNTITTPIDDSNNGSYYSKPFTVRGSQRASWLGYNNNWADGSNWTGGIPPNYTTDVTIPYVDASGNAIKNFPDIGGDPNVGPQNIQARTLVILNDENDPSLQATVTLTSGELQVFGDFRHSLLGFFQDGGTFFLAGNTQSFDGGNFLDVRIQGAGQKTLANRPMNIAGTLYFVPSTTADANNLVTPAAGSGDISVTLGVGAVVLNESDKGYVLGFLRTTRQVLIGTANDFGGIGLSLTTISSSSTNSFTPTVTRLTGRAFSKVGTKGASITRSYTIFPYSSATFKYTIAFSYLISELNGNNAAYLNAYISRSNQSAFTMMEKISDSGQTVLAQLPQQKPGNLSATFTLAENGPLPVTLVSFTATATAQGAALLRWATATEINNRGFGIERQLGANEAWQSVGFVAAGATTGSTYTFTDKSLVSAPASTQAYYRLRQEDIDGTVTYSPVAVINRNAAIASTKLTLSPVPVGGSDNLSVGLAEAGQAGIMVAVINTQGQCLMSFTTQASTDAALSLPVTGLASGVYIVTVQVPGQAARHARFVKL